MELLLITENKLKVRLSKDDLEEYGIKCENIDYDNTETRRVFWSILDEAKRETGFDAAISRIFIQIYPDGRGGCDMYVSHIANGDDGDEQARRGVKLLVNQPSSETRIYGFYRVEHLVLACKRLVECGYHGDSSAFSRQRDGDNCNCFLILETEKGKSDPVTEFGERMRGDAAICFIEEHCLPICRGDAVEVLGAL